MLSGFPPFDGKNDEEILAKVIKANWSFNNPVWSHISREAKDLISALLCPVETRLTAHQALEHPWIARRCAEEPINLKSLENALTSLRNFHSTSKFRDAINLFISTQLISSEENKELTDVFRSLDKNGDGRISRKELLTEYTKFMEEDQASDEVNRMMKEIDTDKSGYIDYTEFLKAALDKKKNLSRDNLRQAFNLFDKDKSGTISARELKFVLENGATSSDGVWKEVLMDLDANGDGEIDIKEFENIVFSKT